MLDEMAYLMLFNWIKIANLNEELSGYLNNLLMQGRKRN
jgi:hypothetical protein